MDDLQKTLPRRLAAKLPDALAASRIVTVVGARQVGKTSLVRHLGGAERQFLSFDDLGTLSQAKADPAGFLEAIDGSCTIDEVQRVPDMMLGLKASVDREPIRGRYLLTGSANFLALAKLSESLAGRMSVLELFPFAQAEIDGANCNVVEQLFDGDPHWKARPLATDELAERIVRGGYPEAVFLDERLRRTWFDSYLIAMLQRDVRDIANVSDVLAMERFLRVVSARTARLLNYASLSSESGIPKTTLIRYTHLLQQIYLTFEIPAWSLELGRRLTKTPKLFTADTGIAAHQMNVDVARIRSDRNLLGGLLETFVASELRKHASWYERRVELYHFRDHSGLEVDFILERSDGVRVAIEVKSSTSPTRSDAAGLLKLMDDPKLGLQRGIVLHTGNEIIPIRKNVHGVPISVFWTGTAN